ncbi:MAG: hypothetical protein Kow0042_16140 [Calditrichia bacterium]
MKANLFVGIITSPFFYFILVIGCFSDAPRDNPLDNQTNTHSYSFGGRVQTYYPHQPNSVLSGAQITLNPENRVAFSDSQGNYGFQGLTPGTYQIICQKSGFLSDTAEVEVPRQNSHDFSLDGLPYFEVIKIASFHISRWFPPDDLYFLTFEVTGNDTDGVEELKTATFQISFPELRDTLQEESAAGKFTYQLFPDEYGLSSLHQLIGREIYFVLEDEFGARVRSSAQYLSRIIEDVPVIIAPVQRVAVNPPFQFQWEPVFLPFDFNLKIEIYRFVSGISIKVAEIPGIAGTETAHTYSNFLSPGEYYWTLYIVDEFGNHSRSKEGAFVVP